jgi:antitoxin component YwqK of YwqJK toxin-antitoxin module
MVRVNVDETDIEHIGGPTATWKGKPFTGIVFELQNDQVINEVTYVEGVENGSEKSWHPNGKLESVGGNRANRPHGPFRTWYPSGQLKNEGVTELGQVIWRKEWDEEGNLISEYKILKHQTTLI